MLWTVVETPKSWLQGYREYTRESSTGVHRGLMQLKASDAATWWKSPTLGKRPVLERLERRKGMTRRSEGRWIASGLNGHMLVWWTTGAGDMDRRRPGIMDSGWLKEIDLTDVNERMYTIWLMDWRTHICYIMLCLPSNFSSRPLSLIKKPSKAIFYS